MILAKEKGKREKTREKERNHVNVIMNEISLQMRYNIVHFTNDKQGKRNAIETLYY